MSDKKAVKSELALQPESANSVPIQDPRYGRVVALRERPYQISDTAYTGSITWPLKTELLHTKYSKHPVCKTAMAALASDIRRCIRLDENSGH